ncbi:complex 1 LYR family protein [Nitzschia inconspicua]|uniref:Succinate dehydrogenase assembly factor 3 n=1 Tax=Nitzschia inconspicua TaxID=303405 RepID=A0A9K3PUP6_9STRA|nr:complex 1 LYR family protein [Nitzschia inconspicua]KAG7360460.1 complex 1 LYR family protein [Nitzschia inconspicua]
MSSTAAATKGKDAALSLYRSIRKAHRRYLPYEMKELGDSYVKSEFKLFKKVTDPAQLDQFYKGWNQYVDQLLQTARTKESIATGSLDQDSKNIDAVSFGRHLPKDVELSEEQRLQLEKLKEETTKAASGR